MKRKGFLIILALIISISLVSAFWPFDWIKEKFTGNVISITPKIVPLVIKDVTDASRKISLGDGKMEYFSVGNSNNLVYLINFDNSYKDNYEGKSYSGVLMVYHTFGAKASEPFVIDISYLNPFNKAKQLQVYFPAFDTSLSGKSMYFYIDALGSTYYADKENDGISDEGREILGVNDALTEAHLARQAPLENEAIDIKTEPKDAATPEVTPPLNNDNAGLSAPSKIKTWAASGNEINIGWEDSSRVKDGFRIYRADAASGPYILLAQLPPNINYYVDSQVSSGKKYYYKLRTFKDYKLRTFKGTVESPDSEVSSLYLQEQDLTPPIISQEHAGELITTKAYSLSISTNELAMCKFSTEDEGYSQMPYSLSETMGIHHIKEINIGDSAGSVKYYIRCKDEAGNINVRAFEAVLNYNIPHDDINTATTADEFVYIEDSATCKDSDNGIFYRKKGNVYVYERKWWTLWLIGEYKNYIDSCNDNKDSLTEYFCDDDSKGERKIACNCLYGTCLRACSEVDWASNLNPAICPANGQQNRIWTKIGECSGGVSKPASEVILCATPSGKGPTPLLDVSYGFPTGSIILKKPLSVPLPGSGYPVIQPGYSQSSAVFLQNLFWYALDFGYYAHCWSRDSPVYQSAAKGTSGFKGVFTPRGSSSVVYIDVSKLPEECAQAEQLEIEYELQGLGLAELNAVSEKPQSCLQPLYSRAFGLIMEQPHTLQTVFTAQSVLVPAREDGGVSKGSFSVSVKNGQEIPLVDSSAEGKKYFAKRVVYLEAFRPFMDYSTPPRMKLTLKSPQCSVSIEPKDINPLVDFDACKGAGDKCGIVLRKDSSNGQIVPITTLNRQAGSNWKVLSHLDGDIKQQVKFLDNGVVVLPQSDRPSNFKDIYFFANDRILPLKFQPLPFSSLPLADSRNDKIAFGANQKIYIFNLIGGSLIKQIDFPSGEIGPDLVGFLDDNRLLYQALTQGATPSLRKIKYYEYDISSGRSSLILEIPSDEGRLILFKGNYLVLFSSLKKGISVYDISLKKITREINEENLKGGIVYASKDQSALAVYTSGDIYYFNANNNEYKKIPAEIRSKIKQIYALEGDKLFVQGDDSSQKIYAYSFTAGTFSLLFDYNSLTSSEKKMVKTSGDMYTTWKNINYFKSTSGQSPYVAYYVVDSSAQTSIENPLLSFYYLKK